MKSKTKDLHNKNIIQTSSVMYASIINTKSKQTKYVVVLISKVYDDKHCLDQQFVKLTKMVYDPFSPAKDLRRKLHPKGKNKAKRKENQR